MNKEILNDAELIVLFRCGIKEALVLLEEKYFQLIDLWIKDLIIQNDAIIAYLDEVYGRVFYGFYRSIEQYRDEEGFFYSYLLLIVRNEIMTIEYKLNKLDRCLLDRGIKSNKGDTLIYYNETSEDDWWAYPKLCFFLKESTELIKESPLLSKVEKEILQMLFDGYSYKEIATKLNISIKNLSYRIQRMRETMKKFQAFF